MSASLDQSRPSCCDAAAELADRAGGESTERFLRRYYRHVATEDLLARAPEDLLGAALSHQQLAASRPVGTANVARLQPRPWRRTAGPAATPSIQIVTDDMPFLVDSVTAELSRQERAVHLVVHPQLVVRRDATGALQEILDVDADGQRASSASTSSPGCTWRSTARAPSEAREAIAARLRRVLVATSATPVEDWPKMTAAVRPDRRRARRASRRPASAPRRSPRPAACWSGWPTTTSPSSATASTPCCARTARTCCAAVPGTGLGPAALRPAAVGLVRPADRQARAKARDHQLLIITKANSRATVHRSTYLDYISVKTFDETGRGDGGEALPRAVHLQRPTPSRCRGSRSSRRRSPRSSSGRGFTPDSHSGKDLLEVLETYPRDELFQTDARRSSTTSRPRCCTCRSGARPSCSCAATGSAGSCPASSTSRATATTPPCA